VAPEVVGQDGHHGGVIAAEGACGQSEGAAQTVRGGGEFPAQEAVADDAARRGDAADSATPGRANRLGDKHVDDGGLDAGAKVAQGGGVGGEVRVVAQEIPDGGFQPAEAEVQGRVVAQRPGEVESVGLAAFGELIDDGSAGVGEAEQFGGFVEALAGGVIESGAEDDVVKRAGDVDEQGVAAADDEGDVRGEDIEVSARGGAVDPR